MACRVSLSKKYIWEEFDETGHNIRVKLSHMHILDILEDLELEGPVTFLCFECSWTVKMLFDRCRIEKDLTVELQKMEFMSKMNLLCYDNLLLPTFMKKHVLPQCSPPDCMSLASDHVITIKCHVILSHDREDEQMDIWRKRSEVFVLCKCPR